MTKQGRNTSGKFEAKSDKPRSVRTMRLTDSAWAKLGEMAESRSITRADLIEEWTKQEGLHLSGQLDLFSNQQIESALAKEKITKSISKTGTELAHRLDVSSAALTNWLKSGKFSEKSRLRDPDSIAWEREPGSKKYRPIL